MAIPFTTCSVVRPDSFATRSSFLSSTYPPAILSSFLDVHEPDYDTRSSTKREQECEAHPVIIRVVDYRLDDVRSDGTRSTIGYAKKSEEHVLIPSWRDFRHHGRQLELVRGR